MSNSQITAGKKERESKKRKKLQEKEERKEARKTNAKKGQALEEMFVYVDENGNLTHVKPEPKTAGSAERKTTNTDNQVLHQGVVLFYNAQKKYGFISDTKTQKRLFVHAEALKHPIKEGDKVVYYIESSSKGDKAVRVQKQ